ncbi:hypothetical protein NMY22_g2342 [Coprinellus aureogranulatus]|nr:hypothetical protein NMY22_g2342 [Coprinellus aureogranulatus]
MWPQLENIDLFNLETLVVEARVTQRVAHDYAVGGLPSFPRLVHFAVVGIPPYMLPPAFPWSQLTHLHLTIDYRCPEEIQQILDKSILLREASIVEYSFPRSSRQPLPWSADRTAKPAVKPLTVMQGLTISGHLQLEADLSSIVWPGLKFLRLISRDAEWTIDILHQMQSLTHLEVSCRRIEPSADPFIKLIDNLPLLVRLILNTSSPIDYPLLFRALTFGPSIPQRRLRHLEELGITCTVQRNRLWEGRGSASTVYSDLESMVDSRTKDHQNPATTCSQLKILAIGVSQGREYNTIVKHIEDVLRSFQGRLSKGCVIRNGYEGTLFEGIFEPWGDGVLGGLVRSPDLF